MQEILTKLIRYTEVADQKIISCFKEYDVPLPQAELLFSHILNAQHLWINRARVTKSLYDRFHLHSVNEFEALHKKNIAELKELVATADLEKEVQYDNMDHTTYANKVGDILFNVVNHSTYHRGQVVTQFKRHGITPPWTDYIVLLRNGEL